MKYMGSKARIAKEIIPILEDAFVKNNCIDFIDACGGGGNLIDKVKFTSNKYMYDVNDYLIEMFKHFQDNEIDVPFIDKDQYNDIKNNKEKYPR